MKLKFWKAPKPKPTREQLDNLRDLFERMIDLDPEMPRIRARWAAEKAIDEAWERAQ